MADVPMKTCAKCGKTKKETDFYKIPNTDERCDLCKTCLTMYIDNRRPDTFKWILKKMDVPYVEKKWVELANKSYMKNPATFGPMSVIGTYLRTMNMEQYKNLKYADSEKINNEKFQQAKKEQQNIKGTSYDEEFENRLLESLKAGEISQAEYNTMSRKSVLDRINEKMRQGEEEVASNPDSVLDTKELEVPENTVDSDDIKKNIDVVSAMPHALMKGRLQTALQKMTLSICLLNGVFSISHLNGLRWKSFIKSMKQTMNYLQTVNRY